MEKKLYLHLVYHNKQKPSYTFSKKLRALIEIKFNVDMNIYFKFFKTGNYFQLKCFTPNWLGWLCPDTIPNGQNLG